jgi:hypothetical protein
MPHPLLQALESVRGWSACACVWRHHLGDAFDSSKTWLFEDTGEHEDHAIPCYGICRRPHHIVIHNLEKNDIVAPPPSPADYCEPVRLTAADIAIWNINQPALIAEISSVLGITASFGITSTTPLLFRLGDKIIDGHRKLAFLVTAYDDNEYKAQIARLAKHPGAVIYIPTNRPAIREHDPHVRQARKDQTAGSVPQRSPRLCLQSLLERTPPDPETHERLPRIYARVVQEPHPPEP